MPSHESGLRRGDHPAFPKVLCLFIIKQSPKLPWRELLWVKSKFFWINGDRRGEVIVPWSVKRVMQVLFRLLKLLWRDGDWRGAGLIIKMIRYSPKICLGAAPDRMRLAPG